MAADRHDAQPSCVDAGPSGARTSGERGPNERRARGREAAHSRLGGHRLRPVRGHRRPGEPDGPAGLLRPRPAGAAPRALAAGGQRPRRRLTRGLRAACARHARRIRPPPGRGPWEEFARGLRFAGGGFDQDDPGSLLDVLEEARNDFGTDPQYVHYLAVPPAAFGRLTLGLAKHGLTDGARVVYEKPYGTSLESFHELDGLVLSVLDEDQVFRIDHFLGKEGTQDLHVLRFANPLFSQVWSRDQVAEVQIDVPEELDVAQRAAFYDAAGATLDMLVTHLFQVAAEVAMEPPASLAPADLLAARESVLSAFRPLDPTTDVVLGQFDGYRAIDGVAAGSTTDTFVAARLWVDTDRWRDVPFLLRTGKRMACTAQRVSLVLRPVDGPIGAVPGRN